MPVSQKQDFGFILQEAHIAASKAQREYLADFRAKLSPDQLAKIQKFCGGIVEPMYCGFAWVNIPGRSPLANYCRKMAKINKERGVSSREAFGSPNWSKGWDFWGPGSYNGQSMEVKEVGAAAFKKVLQDHGVGEGAYVGSRAD